MILLLYFNYKIRDFDKLIHELKDKDEIIDGLNHENEEIRNKLDELELHKNHNEKAKKSAKHEKEAILEDMVKMSSDYDCKIEKLSQEIEKLNTIIKVRDDEIAEMKNKSYDLNEKVYI